MQKDLENLKDFFITSDTWFGRPQILQIANRLQFNNVEEMDKQLVKNWNKKVKKNDIERAIKELKSKVIRTRQNSILNDRKEFTKKSVVKRQEIKKAIYVQKKFHEPCKPHPIATSRVLSVRSHSVQGCDRVQK